MSKKSTIDIGKDFSRYPAGRFQKDGPGSGEQFRTDLLIPALTASDRVEVLLDSTMGYGSSFLEEAFGGAVRHSTMSASEIHGKLDLITSDESLRMEIEEYISQSQPPT